MHIKLYLRMSVHLDVDAYKLISVCGCPSICLTTKKVEYMDTRICTFVYYMYICTSKAGGFGLSETLSPKP